MITRIDISRFPKRIAFAGFGGVGKDEAARVLLERGYQRHNFGDVIKRQADALIREHFGFSAFTEIREEKAKIRRTLESWGEDNYDAILKEFLQALPERCVNTRLARAKEAAAWKQSGGVIIEVFRPGYGPEAPWALATLEELRRGKYLDSVLVNNRDVDCLRLSLVRLLRTMERSE